VITIKIDETSNNKQTELRKQVTTIKQINETSNNKQAELRKQVRII
jgi:hypothetical protein